MSLTYRVLVPLWTRETHFRDGRCFAPNRQALLFAACWNLVMLNDPWRGKTLACIVGFESTDVRILGAPVPFHRHFEEVNLRSRTIEYNVGHPT